MRKPAGRGGGTYQGPTAGRLAGGGAKSGSWALGLRVRSGSQRDGAARRASPTRPVLWLRRALILGVTVKSSPFQFMRDPILYREKLLKPAVLMLEKGVDQEDEALRVLSLRALGNMALGAPRKVCAQR